MIRLCAKQHQRSQFLHSQTVSHPLPVTRYKAWWAGGGGLFSRVIDQATISNMLYSCKHSALEVECSHMHISTHMYLHKHTHARMHAHTHWMTKGMYSADLTVLSSFCLAGTALLSNSFSFKHTHTHPHTHAHTHILFLSLFLSHTHAHTHTHTLSHRNMLSR